MEKGGLTRLRMVYCCFGRVKHMAGRCSALQLVPSGAYAKERSDLAMHPRKAQQVHQISLTLVTGEPSKLGQIIHMEREHEEQLEWNFRNFSLYRRAKPLWLTPRPGEVLSLIS